MELAANTNTRYMPTYEYTVLPHILPCAPHHIWQTAASPFILPTSWQTLYPRCPRCGGNAPNICEDSWPDSWWEDDMMGLMLQGHIPPSRRVAPWEAYYENCRIRSNAATFILTPPDSHIHKKF